MNDQTGTQPTSGQETALARLIARCWADDRFKQELLADPEAVLKAAGVEWPAGGSVRVLANDDKLFHLVIPARPTDLSDEELDKVAGGRTDAHLSSGGVNPLVKSRDKTLNS